MIKLASSQNCKGLPFCYLFHGDMAQGVDITIPVTCSVFEPDLMTSQYTRGVSTVKI